MHALRGFQFLTSLAFLILGVIAVRDWIRSRARSRFHLAAAMGGLGFVSAVGQFNDLTAYRYAHWFTGINLVCFLGSGLALLLFRSDVLPLSRDMKRVAWAGTILVSIAALVVRL